VVGAICSGLGLGLGAATVFEMAAGAALGLPILTGAVSVALAAIGSACLVEVADSGV
jgi:hypothetical protein